MNIVSVLAVLFMTVFYSITSVAHGLPDGSSFIGLKGDRWHAFYVKNGVLEEAVGVINPQEISYSNRHKIIFFVGDDDKLYEYDISSKKIRSIIFPKNITRLSQMSLANTAKGEVLYAISLKGGKSRGTDVVAYSVEKRKFDTIHSQRIAVFEPNIVSGQMVYLGLGCVDMCGLPVQEIWTKTLGKNDAKQITLNHEFIKSPSISLFDKKIYFSMKMKNSVDIWSINFKGEELVQITNTRGTDTHPHMTGDGRLYFLRQEGGRVTLLLLEKNRLKEVDAGVLDGIRDVEIGHV